jgi:hypothetical protein
MFFIFSVPTIQQRKGFDMCEKELSCDQFTNLSLDNLVLKGADDGMSCLELLSIVLCPVSVFHNSACCYTELSRCLPTFFS